MCTRARTRLIWAPWPHSAWAQKQQGILPMLELSLKSFIEDLGASYPPDPVSGATFDLSCQGPPGSEVWGLAGL